MKRHLFILCLALLFCAGFAEAQNRGFGIGIILGEPTGLSGKYWTSNKTAIDGGLAWSFGRGGSLHIHGDYLWHVFDVFKTKEMIPLYFGLGGRIRFANTARLGIRIVGGIDYMVQTVPLDVFLELAPIMDLAPATELRFNGGIGARFFFK